MPRRSPLRALLTALVLLGGGVAVFLGTAASGDLLTEMTDTVTATGEPVLSPAERAWVASHQPAAADLPITETTVTFSCSEAVVESPDEADWATAVFRDGSKHVVPVGGQAAFSVTAPAGLRFDSLWVEGVRYPAPDPTDFDTPCVPVESIEVTFTCAEARIESVAPLSGSVVVLRDGSKRYVPIGGHTAHVVDAPAGVTFDAVYVEGHRFESPDPVDLPGSCGPTATA